MTQKSLISTPGKNKENIKKDKLRKIIQKKRLLLQAIVAKTEMLNVNLELTKKEYMVRIGSLIHKDNHLDFEIIRLKNILLLLNEGYSHDEAINKISQKYYTQQLEMESEQEKIWHDENEYKKFEEQSIESKLNLKKLWKKLITKFHPDLIQDLIEKQKRETIMKQINRAYQEGDLDQLLKIENDNIVIQEMTVDNLEDILVKIINEIIKHNKEYSALKNSEWYGWMIKFEKAKKKSTNIFADTERRLLNDIVMKFEKIKKLKFQIQNFTKKAA